jgi:hypothetical protein
MLRYPREGSRMSIALPQRGDRTWQQQQQLQHRPRLPPVRRKWGPCGARRQCSCDGCRVRSRCSTAISWRNSSTHAQAHQDPSRCRPRDSRRAGAMADADRCHRNPARVSGRRRVAIVSRRAHGAGHECRRTTTSSARSRPQGHGRSAFTFSLHQLGSNPVNSTPGHTL